MREENHVDQFIETLMKTQIITEANIYSLCEKVVS